jgi:GT2 family glycosyltransferase
MKSFTVVTPYSPGPFFERTLLSLTKSALVGRVVIVERHRQSPREPTSHPGGATSPVNLGTSRPNAGGPSSAGVSREPVHLKIPRSRILVAGSLPSHETLSLILAGIRTKYLLLLTGNQQISIEPKALERILGMAESTKAGLVYSDFYDDSEHEKTLHPLNDYQPGSVCDDFDFGAMILFSVPAVRKALKKYGIIPGVKSAGLYDLRLKVSINHSVYHLQEPLYSVIKNVGGIHELPLQEKRFDYVDPGNQAIQKEMETVFTDYLKKIGAYLAPHHLKEVEQTPKFFPVEASVVIPVRNRKQTIAEAVKSALSQKTDFPFNVIVVDNHSTDGTTAALSDLARQYSNLKHIVPVRTDLGDLGIGGCWNEALRHEACGRYAVQLDSDDLYSSASTLQKMVDMLRQGSYAMVIGSYTLVDSRLEEIPPGLIDHREWTDENGHNNALRINGLGAPRAFNTALMRKIGFLNVSYGEDYAAALRICREYRIGRIHESLYLCRRWSGNTDAALSIEEANRNNAFKDKIRTIEILARQKMNQGQKNKP